MEILNNFVVFEGIDGSGTTTQLNLLSDFFRDKRNKLSLPIMHKTFEPTDSSIGKLIRSVLKKETVIRSETIAMLFAADRNEHLYETDGIVDRCKRGEIVVSDRYTLSSLVYQGILCGNTLPARLNEEFPYPELIVFFDLAPEIAAERRSGRDGMNSPEIYEYLDFQVQVRRQYKALLPTLLEKGVMIETINAAPPPDEVAAEVWRIIQNLPIMKMK